MIAREARKTETLGRAKRKGVGGKEFLPALAFRRRRISCQRSWRAASFKVYRFCFLVANYFSKTPLKLSDTNGSNFL